MATIRQRRALAKIVENGGNVSKAMREVGYTAVSASTPSKLTNSKGWNELIEQYLPDTLLAKVHKDGLKAFKFESQMTGKGESEIVKVPDFSVRHKYLETSYKIKNKYTDAPNNNVLIINVAGQSAKRYGTNPGTSDNSGGSA